MSLFKLNFTLLLLLICSLGHAQFQIPDTLEVCPTASTFEINMDFNPSQTTILSQVSNATFTSLSLSDDAFSPLINIGFNFNFYGTTYSNCVISSNNFISFNSNKANTGCVFSTNQALGTSSQSDLKNTILAPFQDINPQNSGNIEYATIGTAPNRAFVARWYDVPMYNCPSLTFCSAIIFYETSNIIETHLINKPDCSWQNGLGIHGLLNSTGTLSEIVYDSDEMVNRDFGNQWTTELEGTRFTPAGSNNYNISNIDFLPIVSLASAEFEDNLGNTYPAQQTTTINNVPGLTYLIASSSICSSSLIDTTIIVDLETDILINGNLSNTINTCPGETVNLSVQNSNNFDSFSWNTGATSASILVSSPGIYTLTATKNGCNVNSQITITNFSNYEIDLGDDITSCISQPVSVNGTTTNTTSYVWNDGSTNPIRTISTSGQYILTGTSNSGCTDSDTINITILPDPVFNLGNDTTLCQGEIFEIGSNVNGASYVWNTSETTALIDVNSTGQYILTASIGSCSSSDTIQVNFTALPIVNLADTLTFCSGDSVIVDATNTNTATYLWHDGSTSPTYTSNTNELIWVTVTDNECSFTDSVQIEEIPIPEFNLGNDTSLCMGDSLILSVPFTDGIYLWNTTEITQDITVNTSGLYFVDYTENGCSYRDSIQVIFNPIPTIDLGNDTIGCLGDSISFDAEFSSTSTYIWHDGSTSSTYHSTSSELVWVTVTLENCSYTDSVNVEFFTQPEPQLGEDTSLCLGQNLTLGNTIPGASYLWNTGDTTSTIDVSTTGDYWVIASIGVCQGTDTISVTFNPTPTINLGNSIDLCIGDSTTFNAFYNSSTTYLWHDGSTNSTYQSNTTELVWVTTTLGDCSFTDSVQVTVHEYPIVNLGNDIEACENDNITLSVQENNAEYLWNTGDTTQSISPTVTGLYSVQVTKNGCLSLDTIGVTFNEIPAINLGNNIDLCEGDSTLLNAFYNSNASYLWHDGSTNSTYQSNSTELVWVTVSLNDCSFTDSVNITVFPYPELELGPDQILCQNDPITLNVTENNASYLWNTGDTTQQITPTNTGLYFVEVEKNGCTSYDSVNVLFNPIPNINLGGNSSICEGDSVTFNAFFNTSSTYLWQDGSTNSTYTSFTTELVWVTVTLDNCTFSDTIQNTVFPYPITNLGNDIVACENDDIAISVTENNANYLWNTGDTTQSITPTTSNSYSVQVTKNGCTSFDTIDVLFNEIPTTNLGNDIDICEGDSTSLNAFYNNSATYLWQDGSTLPNYTSHQTELVWVTVTLANCSFTDSIQITEHPYPILNLGPDQILCEGDPVDLMVTENNASYLWNTGDTTQIISPTTSGLYFVEVEKNGCTVYDSVNLLFNDVPEINLGGATNLCAGDSMTYNAFYSAMATYVWQNGSTNSTYTSHSTELIWVTVSLENCSYTDTVQNTVYPYPDANLGPDISVCEDETVILEIPEIGADYLWNTGDTTKNLHATNSGIYTVQVTKNDCSSFDTINVELKDVPEVFLGNDTTICDGDSVVFNAFYSTNSTYLWHDGSTNPTYTGTETKNISVDITLNGCTSNSIVSLTVNPIPVVNLEQVYEICDGDSVTIDAHYSNTANYLWSTGATTNTEIFYNTNNYWVKITENGCEFHADFKVQVHALPEHSLEDLAICLGETEIVNAFDPSIVSYEWSTGETATAIEIDEEGWYWVDLANVNCSTRDSFYLEVQNVPQYYLPKDTFLCENEPLILNAGSEGSTYFME